MELQVSSTNLVYDHYEVITMRSSLCLTKCPVQKSWSLLTFDVHTLKTFNQYIVHSNQFGTVWSVIMCYWFLGEVCKPGRTCKITQTLRWVNFMGFLYVDAPYKVEETIHFCGDQRSFWPYWSFCYMCSGQTVVSLFLARGKMNLCDPLGLLI